MNIKNNQKFNIKGFTLLELLIVVVILGILSLIASAILFDAADKAKNAAVKANISAASSSLVTQMSVEERSPTTAVEITVASLNDPDDEEGSGDEVKSPYDTTLEAFVDGDSGDKGQVALEGDDDNFIVKIRGYGKNGDSDDPIAVKTVSKIDE